MHSWLNVTWIFLGPHQWLLGTDDLYDVYFNFVCACVSSFVLLCRFALNGNMC